MMRCLSGKAAVVGGYEWPVLAYSARHPIYARDGINLYPWQRLCRLWREKLVNSSRNNHRG